VSKQHGYQVTVRWTGDRGTGTDSHRTYSRDHDVSADGPAVIAGSSDPGFRGDAGRWNPEQLFLASVSQCHMLWYLSLAAEAGVVVTGYRDEATATMVEEPSGAGQFTEMTLHPQVTITDPAHEGRAQQLHHRAGEMCFIARSVNFPVRHQATVSVQPLR
jgi:organic hydroperoxide reductase OsmC/OhrA